VANVPEWFPGAGFKRLAREWRQTLKQMVDLPYKFVKDQMVTKCLCCCHHELNVLQDAGIAPMSFTSNLLEGRILSAEEDHVVKWSAASLYSGGADTVGSSSYHHIVGIDTCLQTVSTIYSLFLAMTLFPDVQKKAQAEIDAVVGTDRLPSFADRESLPYIEALVKEVLRWNAVGPTGVWISFIVFFNYQTLSLNDSYPPSHHRGRYP